MIRTRLFFLGAAALLVVSGVCGLVFAPVTRFGIGLAQAQTAPRVVPSSPADLRLSYAPLVKQTAAAVVNVYAARAVENRNPLFNDPFFRRFFGGGEGQGMPREQMQRSLGSGVIVDSSGLVVTNVHVIEGATEVKVSLSDKREFEADIVLKDARTDLAVLRLKDTHERFPSIPFANSDELQVGDVVLAIGNPFGVGQTVTHGIVSALARTQVGISDYQFFIQTDAAINPGNSGGPLIDMTGHLAGINTAIYSRSGGSQGIGFAIPANMVRVVVASAKSGGSAVKRPWLGAKLQAVTTDIAEGLALKRPTGALVAAVTDASPADKAGLKAGDVITSVDSQPVDDPNAFDYRFATQPLGGSAKLGIVRGGKESVVSIALQTAPDVPRDEMVITGRSPFQGLKVSNISPALADELHLDIAGKGVVVLEIAAGSPGQMFGFQPGDVVEAVNDTPIARTRDLETASAARTRQWRVTITRGGQRQTVTFNG